MRPALTTAGTQCPRLQRRAYHSPLPPPWIKAPTPCCHCCCSRGPRHPVTFHHPATCHALGKTRYAPAVLMQRGPRNSLRQAPRP